MQVKNLSKLQTLAMALFVGLCSSCLLFGSIYLLETANSAWQMGNALLLRLQIVCAIAGLLTSLSAWLVFKDEQTKYSFYR